MAKVRRLCRLGVHKWIVVPIIMNGEKKGEFKKCKHCGLVKND